MREIAAIDHLLDHREDVFRICLGFCANYEEAEDLAQDVYVKACEGIDRLRDPGQARAWLLRITRNAGVDHFRRSRRRANLLKSWTKAAPRPDVPVESETARDPRLAELKAAIAALPARYREVFVLREYGRLPYEEISRALGLKEGTVMSRLSRARARVAGMIRRRNS